MTDEEAIKQLSLIIASQGSIFQTQSGASCRAIFHAINAMNARKHGEWIDCGEYYRCPFCSNWVLTVDGKPKFCDECGADMGGEK